MKKIAAVIGLIVFLAGPAFAQSAKVDPATDAAVRKLFVSTNYRTVMLNAMAQMTKSMPAMIRASVTRSIEADTRLNNVQQKQAMMEAEMMMPKVMAAADRVLTDPALIDEMIDEMIPLYARTYTVGELEQVSAFYASPTGKKTLETMPQMMAAGMEIGQRIVTPRLQKVMAEVMPARPK